MAGDNREPESADLRYLRHEMRTPVNHILSYAELLLDDARDAGYVELVTILEAIQVAGKASLTLVNTMLDDERPASDAELERSRAALTALLQEVVASVDRAGDHVVVQSSPEIGADLARIAGAAQRLTTVAQSVGSSSPPQSPVRAGAGPADSGAVLAGTPPAAGGLILAVDDHELNLDVLGRTLGRLGYSVLRADNGRRALEILETNPVDLLLLDIVMPEMDGFEVLSVRRLNPRLRDIPVIMISALDDLESVVRCIEMGADDYLLKPFDPTLLQARVGACLEKKRLRDLEVEYLEQVEVVTSAAASVESRTDLPIDLAHVAERSDALGQLARVFQTMAREVYAREDRLRQELVQLRVQVDQSKKARQVAEVTETEYFQQLQQRAAELRNRVRSAEDRIEGADR
jgi:CheY-like chemotaxis protein